MYNIYNSAKNTIKLIFKFGVGLGCIGLGTPDLGSVGLRKRKFIRFWVRMGFMNVGLDLRWARKNSAHFNLYNKAVIFYWE